MRHYQLILLGALLWCVIAGFAGAYTTPESIEAAANVYVSNVSYSPGSFYPGDEGTLTVKVTNGNADTGIVVSHATVYDDNNRFTITSPPYTTATTIGPGQTQTFTFTLEAESIGDAICYPVFSLDFRDSNSLWHRTSVTIEDAPLELTITDRPDTFTQGGKETVTVTVWNPRESTVRSVVIAPSGSGITSTPIKAYVGDLGPGASKEVSFEVTPSQETELAFTATYLNGNNEHESSITIPVNFGKDKLGAELVVNNIENTNSAGTMTLKGDITNIGLSDAKSILVTVGSPATPINPNPVYAVGNLEPDDFSSFEVTYTSTGMGGTIPLLVEYKDEDGNVYDEQFSINLNGNTATASGATGTAQSAMGTSSGASSGRGGMFGSFGSGMNQIPVTQIVIVLVAIVALVIAWRKGLLRRLSEKVRGLRSAANNPRDR
jgi:hypothetical protein